MEKILTFQVTLTRLTDEHFEMVLLQRAKKHFCWTLRNKTLLFQSYCLQTDFCSNGFEVKYTFVPA